jgi:CheY-like chemotaxis protein
VFERRGATVITAGSASDALASVESSRPDVLVSDIGLPGEDGYALIRKVRALDPARGGRVPAIAVTAHARAEDGSRALAEGFQMHLAKPIEPGALIALVASLAEASRA